MSKPLSLFRFAFTAMASPCELQLYAESAASADIAAGAAIAEVQRIEQKYSRYRDDSALSGLNRAAGGEPVVVDAETAPAKVATYQKVLHTTISNDQAEAAEQLNANPGLWVRLHPNFKSFVLPNLGV